MRAHIGGDAHGAPHRRIPSRLWHRACGAHVAEMNPALTKAASGEGALTLTWSEATFGGSKGAQKFENAR